MTVCSDGLTSELDKSEITRIVEANADQPRAAVTRLIEKANEKGGEDNITAVEAGFGSLSDRDIPLPGEEFV